MAFDSAHNKEGHFISEGKGNEKDAGIGLSSGLNFYYFNFIVLIYF
jgi:hypothetical protein